MPRLFELINLAVMPFWLLMILAPGWRFTERLQRSLLGVLAPAAIYVALVLPRAAELWPVVTRPDLAGVAAALSTPAGATIAWAHFLAFDLFVGRFVYLDGRERGLSAWLLSPLLVLTLMFGPLGLLAYLIVRALAGPRVRALSARVAEGSWPLVAVSIGSLGLLVLSLGLQLVDGRQVLGASTWLKPAKFGISVVLTAGTLALLLRGLQPLTRGARRAVGLIAGLFAAELVLLVVQAARGVPSHFNNRTPFDISLFGIMGTAIIVAWFAIGYLTWRAFRQPIDGAGTGRDGGPAPGPASESVRARAWGLRLGLVSLLLGSGLGGLMPRPTAAQIESLRAGRPTPMLGAHAVGVEDGGPGLPVTRWSTTGGDLRIPHFVGMHGLQLLPLIGWYLSRRRHPRATRLTVAAGTGYFGLTGALLLQALRGQPLLAPDLWTALSLLGAAAIAAVVAYLPMGGSAASRPVGKLAAVAK